MAANRVHSCSSNIRLLESRGCTKVQFTKVRYIWRVQNFSLCCDNTSQGVRSPKFPSESSSSSDYGLKWYLKMHRTGELHGYKIITVYLKLASCNVSGVHADYKFGFLNAKGEAVNTWKGSNKFEPKPPKNSRGFNVKITNDLVIHNTLTIISEIIVPTGSINILEDLPSPQFRLAEDLGGMFENQEFSDVTFYVNGRKLQAHKVILAARSPVFKAMFEHEMLEKHSNQVEITDIDYEVLREVIRFVYTEKVCNLDKITKELLAAADKYALESLKTMCENNLCLRVSVENASDMFMFADTYNAVNLKDQAREYINNHAVDVSKTAGWKLMVNSHPKLIAEAFIALATQQQGTSTESPTKRQRLN